MILVTGATGFIGRHLLTALEASGEPVRILLRPKRATPTLPSGLSLDVTLASLSDQPGVRAAMKGVDTVIHLASAAQQGPTAALWRADVRGTELLAQAAADAGVGRLLFLSHLGANRSSAFPLLRTKALAEEHLQRANLPAVILRSGVVFGPGDHFLTAIAMMASIVPFVFPLPGEGQVLLHPLWIDDLITAVMWMLAEPEWPVGTYEIGGPEHLSLAEITQLVMARTGLQRWPMGMRPIYLRGLVWMSEYLMPHAPITRHNLDYVSMNRTAPLDSMARLVGLQPSRLVDRIGFLPRRGWARSFLRSQFSPETV